MRDFSTHFLSSLSEVDGFILKYPLAFLRHEGYQGLFRLRKCSCSIKDAGFFGGAVVNSFPELAIEDEGRLRNFNIREHFLTKLYALASFREMENEASVSDLIQFHTANKLLLAAHSQKESKILGNIVANRENLGFAEQARLYQKAPGRSPQEAAQIYL